MDCRLVGVHPFTGAVDKNTAASLHGLFLVIEMNVKINLWLFTGMKVRAATDCRQEKEQGCCRLKLPDAFF